MTIFEKLDGYLRRIERMSREVKSNEWEETIEAIRIDATLARRLIEDQGKGAKR